jgi:hypothetical protein
MVKILFFYSLHFIIKHQCAHTEIRKRDDVVEEREEEITLARFCSQSKTNLLDIAF